MAVGEEVTIALLEMEDLEEEVELQAILGLVVEEQAPLEMTGVVVITYMEIMCKTAVVGVLLQRVWMPQVQ